MRVCRVLNLCVLHACVGVVRVVHLTRAWCHRGPPTVRRSSLPALGPTKFPRFIVLSTAAPTFSLAPSPAATAFCFIEFTRCLLCRCLYRRFIGVIVAFLFLHAVYGFTTAAHCYSNDSNCLGLYALATFELDAPRPWMPCPLPVGQGSPWSRSRQVPRGGSRTCQ